MAEEPLYHVGKLKVDPDPRYPEDHFLYIEQAENKEPFGALLQRGVLDELAHTPNTTDLERKLDNVNPLILYVMGNEGVGIHAVEIALKGAYAEDERRIDEFVQAEKAERETRDTQ